MAIIPIENCRIGMILSKNVEKHDSRAVILASGTILNQKKILHLKRLGIKHVNVFSKNDKTVITNKEFINKHRKLEDKARNMFNKVKVGKTILISEMQNEINSMIDEIEKNNNILSKMRQLKQNDDYTFKHSIDVCMLATMLGKWLGYPKKELNKIAIAGIFHDIGKIKIPDSILNKPSKLSRDEFDIMKKHTILGYDILRKTNDLDEGILYAALEHHEREDGSGYPIGLKSQRIHEYAKIIAICDVFDAMTSVRVYKSKESPFKVAEQIISDSFGILDARISRVFLNNISKFYVGNLVKLNNDSIGQIIYVHKQRPTRPVVKIDDEYVDLLKQNDIDIIDVIN